MNLSFVLIVLTVVVGVLDIGMLIRLGKKEGAEGESSLGCILTPDRRGPRTPAGERRLR